MKHLKLIDTTEAVSEFCDLIRYISGKPNAGQYLRVWAVLMDESARDGEWDDEDTDRPMIGTIFEAKKVLVHDAVLELRRDGLTVAQIAKKLGVSRYTIYRRIREMADQQREEAGFTAIAGGVRG